MNARAVMGTAFGLAVAAAAVAVTPVAQAGAPAVRVASGEAVWLTVEGAPPGTCGGRHDAVRAAPVAGDEIEVVYEAAHGPCSAGEVPGAPVAPLQLLVEGLRAGEYAVKVTGGLATRFEAVQPMRLMGLGPGEGATAGIVDPRGDPGACVGYLALADPPGALALFPARRADTGVRCLPSDGHGGAVFRAAGSISHAGMTLWLAAPLGPGATSYGDAHKMGPPTRLTGAPPDAEDMGVAPASPGAAPAAVSTASWVGAKPSDLGGLHVAAAAELWDSGTPKLFRPGVTSGAGLVRLHLENASSGAVVAKVVRVTVVDAAGWAHKAHTTPHHPPAVALAPGDALDLSYELRKLPAMPSGTSWTVRVEIVAGGKLHVLTSAPVVAGVRGAPYAY
jgi:hypothetical protein